MEEELLESKDDSDGVPGAALKGEHFSLEKHLAL
jgi:hypothetical protein